MRRHLGMDVAFVGRFVDGRRRFEYVDTDLPTSPVGVGAGARVAVDDAGSGYAGLQRILQLQPEVLKLDRTLVTGLGYHAGRRAMVEAMVGFAGKVGATVVAEGVETREDLEVLRQTGVHLGQGYHLGRPTLDFALDLTNESGSDPDQPMSSKTLKIGR